MYLTQSMSRGEALKTLLTTEKARMLVSIVSAILCSFVEIIPWIMLYLGAHALRIGEPVYPYMIIMAISLAGRYLLYMLAVWQAHQAAYHIIQNVRKSIVQALANLPGEKLGRFHRGDLEKRVSDDCQNLEPLIAHHSTDIINGLLLPLLMVGMLFYIDWRLALVALIPLPLAAVMQYFMMRDFGERQEKYDSIVSSMHQAQLEFLRNIGVMKLFAVDSDSYQQLSATMKRHHKLVGTYTHQLIGAWVNFVTLAQTSLMFMVPLALVLAVSGEITVVDLAIAVCLCAGILRPWLELTQLLGQVQKAMLSIDRLLPLFDDSKEETTDFQEPLSKLKCCDLALSRGKRPIFSQLNAEFYPGERVVIQGASGSGKSSLLMLLSGTLSPTQGDWFINQQKVSELGDKNRSQYIAVVDQQSTFFSGSLGSNLRLANDKINDEQLWFLIDRMGLGDLIRQLPQQLDTDIGETSRRFSGGEMQRLSIIRAAVAKTPVLILDEVTAHLDQYLEQEVLNTLRDYAPFQIQLVISHKAHAVKQADRWMVLQPDGLKEVSHG